MISVRASKLADFTLKVITIIGALFAGYQYLESRSDLRVSRTLDYVNKLDSNSSRVGKSYNGVVTKTLNDYHNSIARFNLAKLSEEKASILRDKLLKGILSRSAEGIEGDSFKDALNDVVIFYEQLQICIEEDLCDKQTAETFFQNDARRLWENFNIYLLKIRKITPGYANGIEKFSNI